MKKESTLEFEKFVNRLILFLTIAFSVLFLALTAILFVELIKLVGRIAA